MHILYIAPEIDVPGVHGGSSHVEGQINSFSRLGHSVIAVTRWKLGLAFFSYSRHLFILRLPIFIPFLRTLLYFFYSFLSVIFLGFFWADLIYERGRVFGGIGVLLGSLLYKKTVYELNEPYTSSLLLEGKLNSESFLYKIILVFHNLVVRSAALVVGTHPSFGRDLHQRYYTITYGVDPEKFTPHIPHQKITHKYHLKKNRTFLYLGSFSPWHTCSQIIYASRIVLQKYPDIKVLFVGEGGSYNACRLLTENLGLSRSLLFLGRVAYNQIPAHVAAADFCFSLFDRTYPPFKKFPFYYSPLKIHEYKAAGKPIIASNLGNIRHLVRHKVHGFLVNEQSVSAIARAMLTLIEHPAMVRDMGKQCRQDVLKHYTWEKINTRILHLLHFTSDN